MAECGSNPTPRHPPRAEIQYRDVKGALISAQEISMKIGVGRWPDALDLLLNFDERLRESCYSLVAPVAADYANQGLE